MTPKSTPVSTPPWSAASASMRAAVFRRYGPPEVVGVEEVATPVPKEGELLVRVRATTVSSGDARMRSFNMPGGFWLPARLALGIFGPRTRVLGFDFAGDVVAVGKQVAKFKPGDAVFGAAAASHAEYVVVRESKRVALKPDNLSYDHAATIPFGGITALVFLHQRAKIAPGERVLINGASGSVGTAAVQLAKHFGAHVTGVCSAANAALVMSLGADATIDHATRDLAASGATCDVIFDAVGDCSFARCKGALADGGRLILIVGSLGQMLFLPSWAKWSGSKRVISGVAGGSSEDLRFLAGLASAGTFKPVIDSSYPLERIVQAHARVDTGRKRGNVIVTMG